MAGLTAYMYELEMAAVGTIWIQPEFMFDASIRGSIPHLHMRLWIRMCS